jgi:hypothetical protein
MQPSMEENKAHTKIVDDLIYEVFKDDRNGAVVGQMRNSFRKVAAAAMKHGFGSGHQIGYDSGFKQGVKAGRTDAVNKVNWDIQ